MFLYGFHLVRAVGVCYAQVSSFFIFVFNYNCDSTVCSLFDCFLRGVLVATRLFLWLYIYYSFVRLVCFFIELNRVVFYFENKILRDFFLLRFVIFFGSVFHPSLSSLPCLLCNCIMLSSRLLIILFDVEFVLLRCV